MPVDVHKAIAFYRLGIERGQVSDSLLSLYQLARAYSKVRDFRQSYLWAALALIGSNETAASASTLLSSVGGQLTSEQIAESRQRASDCFARFYRGC